MEVLTTNGITVCVETVYLSNQPKRNEGEHIFGYHITIENGSPHTVQLLSRHWIIKDADGTVRHVKGEGVVGQKPILAPGEYHEYTSFCNLRHELGKMGGTYTMIKLTDGSLFDVDIPEFHMMVPHKMN